MFGTSGIRGPVGEDVTADLALAVGRALAIDTESVVIGRDARDSGRFLCDALTAGLCESGTDVIDLGLAATPTVARGVGWYDADAGVSITASHNPAPDNGLKLWQPSGQAFDESRRETIEERVRNGRFDPAPWNDLGERREADATDRHVAALREAVDLHEPLSVVVDLGNGAGGVTIDALDALDCAVETLNAQPDGGFPGRPSEPTPENCESLRALVESTDADLGIAHDGDADRLRAVTGDGEFLSGDATLALFAREVASEGEAVAVPVDTSLAVADALDERGASVAYTRVGDVFVAERAAEPGVPFGGEPSGAWIWPGETLCPDGPLAACKLVELASRRSLAERVADIDTYATTRESIDVAADRKERVMDRVRETVLERYEEVRTLDGVRVDREGAWFLVRASGTQPLIRLSAEAKGEERAADALATARDLVTGAVAATDADR